MIFVPSVILKLQTLELLQIKVASFIADNNFMIINVAKTLKS